MNGAGNRFLYIATDDAGTYQLATIDINPTSPGAAPAISSPLVTQSWVQQNGG